MSLVEVHQSTFAQLTISLSNEASDAVLIPAALGSTIGDGASFSIIRYPNGSIYQDLLQNGRIVSAVVSVAVSSIAPGQSFSPPVQITFELPQPVPANTTLYCCYFDFERSTWLTDGVALDSTQGSGKRAVCIASHLTNFAVLGNYNPQLASSVAPVSSGTVTLAGVIIAVVLMGIVVLALLPFKVCAIRARRWL